MIKISELWWRQFFLKTNKNRQIQNWFAIISGKLHFFSTQVAGLSKICLYKNFSQNFIVLQYSKMVD